MKELEDEHPDNEDSLHDAGEEDDATINLADAMNLYGDVGDDFSGSYSL